MNREESFGALPYFLDFYNEVIFKVIYKQRLDKLRSRVGEIETLISQPDVVKDQNQFQSLSKELFRIRPVVEAYAEYEKVAEELHGVTQELKQDSIDDDMRSMYEEESERLTKESEVLIEKIEGLLLKGSDPRMGRDVMLEIRAGTGGEEAALFAADLFRMYSRAASEKGCRIETMDISETGNGGLKEIIFSISGEEAYAHFKYESGIHRVQRVPSTESSGRIHTSAVTVALMVEVSETEVNINPQDLRIDVYRAQGAGGQHVNKTESAVRITHIPTNVVVTCQDERSQHKNKAKAMRVLRARIYEAEEEKRGKEIAKERKDQVGSGDRSGKIRTYNFPDSRVTDHRIGLTLHSLSDILDGHLDDLVEALENDERQKKLSEIVS